MVFHLALHRENKGTVPQEFLAVGSDEPAACRLQFNG
jgi:hypothetical protein